MQIDLSGKTALVTGSSEGIGLAVAKRLAGSGAAVILNGRSQEKIDTALAALEAAAPKVKATAVVADLATAEGCKAVVEQAPAVDILVNNAGMFQPADFFDTPDDVWEAHWQLNVMAGVRLARAYLPGMEKAGWGRVVFLSSESGLNIPVEMIHYGVTKTADIAVARGLAKRMAGTGVTVNSVLPGPTLSEGVAEMLRDRPADKSLEEAAADFVKTHRPSNLLRRAATVEEVANMVAYVVSPLASATTGAALRVDGGTVDSL